jgi:hypothetical protein
MSDYWKNASLDSVLSELDRYSKDGGFVLVNPDVLARAAALLRPLKEQQDKADAAYRKRFLPQTPEETADFYRRYATIQRGR